jgi:hypothetical protein
MTNIFSLIRIDGTVTSVPALTSDNLVEFVVVDDSTRAEYLVRLPRTELGTEVSFGAQVRATGAEGWIVPGRGWLGESSRTILEAHDVQLSEYAFAA